MLGLGFLFSVGLEGFAYSQLATFGKPQYDEDDDLIFGGADLSMRGMCGHYHDLLYVTFGAQVCCSLPFVMHTGPEGEVDNTE